MSTLLGTLRRYTSVIQASGTNFACFILPGHNLRSSLTASLCSLTLPTLFENLSAPLFSMLALSLSLPLSLIVVSFCVLVVSFVVLIDHVVVCGHDVGGCWC